MSSDIESVSAKITGSRVTIDFASFGLPDDVLERRIDEVLPLLSSLVAADESWASLSEKEIEERGEGIVAMDLMSQRATHAAVQRAQLLKAIVDGSEPITSFELPNLE